MGEAKRRKLSGEYERDYKRRYFKYIKIALLAVAAVVFLLGVFLPDEFNTVSFICIRVALSIVPLTFAWLSCKNTPIWAKILASLMVIPLWLPFIGNKITLAANIVCLFVSVFLLLYFYLIKKIKAESFIFYSWWFFLMSLKRATDYTFVNKPNAIHFWQISLAFSICVTIVVAVLLIKNKIVLKDNRVSEKVAAIFLAFLISFCFSFPIPPHLNYLLDFGGTKEFWAEIEEKDIRVTRTRRTYRKDYYFYFDIDGKEVKMDVSESEYSFYEEGEYYPIRLYSGAFDDPFYFSGNIED